MSKLLFKVTVLSLLSIFLNSCAPSQSMTATDTIPISGELATSTPLPIITPQLTQTADAIPVTPGTIRVPEDQPTIQAGIDAVPDGGIVLVAPGTYTENLTIADKSVILASQFHTTGDERFINSTVIDGNGVTTIFVTRTAGPHTKIIGFTIQNGDDGIRARANLQILNNHFRDNKDGVDYANGGGLNSGNIYENNIDDGIDLDGATEAIIENNIIRNNRNDGIEISLPEYLGPTLNIVIRNNIISGNRDGIKLVDFPDVSSRVFLIERNLFDRNRQAGLGIMDNGETKEDFRAASIPERIYLINNTFLGNSHAVSGGGNLIALNNIFLNSTTLALKNVDGNSIAAYNLFWNNATDSQGGNIDDSTSLFVDPLLDANAQLRPGSPAIDAGAIHFEWDGKVILDLPVSAFFGTAPDLGAFESNFTQVSRDAHMPDYAR